MDVTGTVAILAPGRMGSALARRLVEAGATVRTLLEGRSAETRARAAAAGMIESSLADVAACDIILSVVPPSEAVGQAARLAAVLRGTEHDPLYIDLNAINAETARVVEAELAHTRARFVDGCIIGTMPADNYDGPFLYFSGAHAQAACVLGEAGFDVNVLAAPNGAASTLKMCFAGIMKGLSALGVTMVLAARRAGASQALMDELARSQPELSFWFDRQIPAMYPKTYRWVAEMQEIAAFLQDDPAGRKMFEGAADLFARLSQTDAAAAQDLAALRSVF